MKQIDWVYQQYVERRFPLPSEDDIARLEARLNLRFPPDYRQFLLDYNGGWFGDHELAVPEDVWNDRIHCLYGIRADHEAGELGQPSDMSLFDDNDRRRSSSSDIRRPTNSSFWECILKRTARSSSRRTGREPPKRKRSGFGGQIRSKTISEPHSEEDAI